MLAAHTTVINKEMIVNKFRSMENQKKMIKRQCENELDLSCKFSSSSLFFKIHGRKSRDNFTNILLKIQNDLSTLSNKLSDLESKIQL